jgi:hypothetical protein
VKETPKEWMHLFDSIIGFDEDSFGTDGYWGMKIVTVNVTFDFFLRQTKTQDLVLFGNGQHKLVRPGPNLVFSCSDSPNIFLYRFTSEKDQIDDWFCLEMEKTW